MLNSKKITGDLGETLACDYLVQLGFKILDRNFFIRGGELDIVAKKDDELVFVEVKTRYNHEFGLPEESVNYYKIRSLIKSAQIYAQRINWGERGYRIDLVTVDFSDSRDKPKIKVFQNITY